jgi:hypothetical protein
MRFRKEALKEYSIGTMLFDRPADFDPRLDSIVRVEATKLRARLVSYYATSGESARADRHSELAICSKEAYGKKETGCALRLN